MPPGRLEGWLQKQGHLWKSWLRRYFKQTGEPGGDLVYYETDALSKEKGRICLRTATLLPCSDKPLMFGVKEAGGKTYLLRAPSPEDAERWLRALGGEVQSAPSPYNARTADELLFEAIDSSMGDASRA